MKARIVRFIIVFFLFFLPACQNRNSQVVRKQTAVPTSSITAPPEVTKPTATQTAAPSPSPTSPTLPEMYGVQKECFAMIPGFPADRSPQGTLIVGYQLNQEFLDLKTGKITRPAAKWGDSELQVSPDRKKVAYHNIKNNQIVVMNEKGQIIRTIAWEKSWYSLARWQNNEDVLIVTEELLESNNPDSPNVLALVNTVTGQTQKLIPDYPFIAQSYSLPWSFGHPVYDPTLSRVVYAQNTRESQNYALWDIQGKRELIALPNMGSEEPVWSPDGSTFIVFTYTQNGLSLVSRDGAIVHAIDINKMARPGAYNPHYSARDFRYSPDGNRVAFWLVSPEYQEDPERYRLAILDTRDGKVTDTCIEQGDYLYGLAWIQPQLVWSPDSTQVAAYINYQESVDTWDVIIADVAQKNFVRIAQHQLPLGWIVKAP